jgi:hypothetical protein
MKPNIIWDRLEEPSVTSWFCAFRILSYTCIGGLRSQLYTAVLYFHCRLAVDSGRGEDFSVPDEIVDSDVG